MNRIMIHELLQKGSINQDYKISGWVRTKRGSKNIAFIMLNDGSCLEDVQIIIENKNLLNNSISLISTGSSISVLGTLIASEGKGQKVELIAKEIQIIGTADPETYPLQPKKHT